MWVLFKLKWFLNNLMKLKYQKQQQIHVQINHVLRSTKGFDQVNKPPKIWWNDLILIKISGKNVFTYQRSCSGNVNNGLPSANTRIFPRPLYEFEINRRAKMFSICDEIIYILSAPRLLPFRSQCTRGNLPLNFYNLIISHYKSQSKRNCALLAINNNERTKSLR